MSVNIETSVPCTVQEAEDWFWRRHENACAAPAHAPSDDRAARRWGADRFLTVCTLSPFVAVIYALLRGDWTEIAERARRQHESAGRDGPLIISNGSGLCDGTDPAIVDRWLQYANELAS